MLIRNEVYKKEGCLPQKIPIASFLQMPLWIYLTAAIRNITSGNFGHEIQMEQIRNESLLWVMKNIVFQNHFIFLKFKNNFR